LCGKIRNISGQIGICIIERVIGMKNYTVISKIALVICFCFILLAVVNGFTGFINSSISLSGTLICIIGFGIAIFAITILENERQKKKADKS
jgi:uncharacterized protein YhhL (DUF1145 family)